MNAERDAFTAWFNRKYPDLSPSLSLSICAVSEEAWNARAALVPVSPPAGDAVLPAPVGEIVGRRYMPEGTREFWGYFSEDAPPPGVKMRVVTVEQALEYGAACAARAAAPAAPAQPIAWLWVNPDGTKEVTHCNPESDPDFNTGLALALDRTYTPLYVGPQAAPAAAPAYKSCRMDDGRCGICGGDWSVCGCDGMLRRHAPTPGMQSKSFEVER